MAEPVTLARPYAKAAFEYALACNELQAWSDMLSIATVVASQDHIVAFIASPSFTVQEKGRAFVDVCGDELSEKAQNFIKHLAVNNRLSLLPQIRELYDNYKSQQEKSIDVEVLTAFELSTDVQTKLANALGAKLDREVNVQSSIDKSLLGGAIVRAGDTVIDGSVRGRLAKLAEAMNA